MAAAALAIARYQLHARRALVVVTFTRSAAAIKAKSANTCEGLFLTSRWVCRSYLHGLALNIATRHADLSGLQLDSATLITPNQSHRLIRTCVEQWIATIHALIPSSWKVVNLTGKKQSVCRQSVLRTEVLRAGF